MKDDNKQITQNHLDQARERYHRASKANDWDDMEYWQQAIELIKQQQKVNGWA